MEIVRLISVGTSSSVTAHSTYFSGDSVIFDVMLDIAVVADSVAVYCQNILASDPMTAHIAAVGAAKIGATTAWASKIFLIGRAVKAMTLNNPPRRLKQRTASDTKHHGSSPSSISMYYPQSQPCPSRKSLHGHLLSGFLSYLHGQ